MQNSTLEARPKIPPRPQRSCALDGEAVVVDEQGLSVFDPLRYRLRDHDAVPCAFDMLELDGADFRLLPLERRKERLAELLRGVDRIAFNSHFTGDGAMIFKHACTLGCEGIVRHFFRLAPGEVVWPSVSTEPVMDLISAP